MQRPFERPDRAGDRRIQIRKRRRNHPRRKRRRIELMLGIDDQRRLHEPPMLVDRLLPSQQPQDMPGDRAIRRLRVDPRPAVGIPKPITHHRWNRRQQPIRHIVLPRETTLRLERSQHRAAGPQHVHRMRRRRNPLQHFLERRRQAAHRTQPFQILLELRRVRQLPIQEQIRDLFKNRMLRQILDAVSTIVERIAARPHRANRRRSRHGPAQTTRRMLLIHNSAPLC